MINREHTSSAGRPRGPGGPIAWAAMLATLIVIGVVVYVLTHDEAQPAVAPPTLTAVEQTLASAKVSIAQGRDIDACQAMIDYLKTHPSDVEVRPLLARTLWRLGQAQEAELTVDDVLRLAPQLAESLWLKGELVRARGGQRWMNFFQKAADSPIGGSPTYQARYARELIHEDKPDDAEVYYRKAVDAGLDDAATQEVAAQLALRRGDYSQAVAQARKALSTQRDAPVVWSLLAKAQRQADGLAQAEATLNEALKACRDRGELLMQLGRLRLEQGQVAKAAEAFEAATHYQQVRSGAALEAARAMFQIKRFADAMHFIDIAAEALGEQNSDVAGLKKQIEDARFGPVETGR